ncbi:MAG: hypothetical protein CM15mP18_0320 [Methanobacteriota archaeon]|nr:MAG: hypothetical protein CM15mP18_0320 [Euryarchaeota archaeon]
MSEGSGSTLIPPRFRRGLDGRLGMSAHSGGLRPFNFYGHRKAVAFEGEISKKSDVSSFFPQPGPFLYAIMIFPRGHVLLGLHVQHVGKPRRRCGGTAATRGCSPRSASKMSTGALKVTLGKKGCQGGVSSRSSDIGGGPPPRGGRACFRPPAHSCVNAALSSPS